jgi:hypothetical protein
MQITTHFIYFFSFGFSCDWEFTVGALVRRVQSDTEGDEGNVQRCDFKPTGGQYCADAAEMCCDLQKDLHVVIYWW